VELISLPFLDCRVMEEQFIANLDLLSSNSLIIVVLLTLLGSSQVLPGMLMDFFQDVTQVPYVLLYFWLVVWLSSKHDIYW